MLRASQVFLTILGILACPYFCLGGVGACDDRPDSAAGPALASHECESTASCCGAEGCCCPKEKSSSERAPASNGCNNHGCVCNGAIESRHNQVLDIQVPAEATCRCDLATPKSESFEAGALGRLCADRPFAQLDSGRSIRLVLESLLL